MSSYTIPYVIEKTPAGERSFDIYSRLLQERIVFVGTDIDDGVANVVMAQLLHLSYVAPDREVSLYVNIELHRRVARGFRNRENYRLRTLLIGGGLTL